MKHQWSVNEKVASEAEYYQISTLKYKRYIKNIRYSTTIHGENYKKITTRKY